MNTGLERGPQGALRARAVRDRPQPPRPAARSSGASRTTSRTRSSSTCQMHTLPCKTSSAPNPTAKDGADVHLTGELLDCWDRPYDGKWDLQLAVKNLGPTLRTCIKSTMGGDNLNGTITLSRAVHRDRRKVALDLEDLDFDMPLSAGRGAGAADARRGPRRHRSRQRAGLHREDEGARPRRQGARRGDGRRRRSAEAVRRERERRHHQADRHRAVPAAEDRGSGGAASSPAS